MNNITIKDLKDAIRFLKTLDKSIKISNYKTKSSMIEFLKSMHYDMNSFTKKKATKSSLDLVYDKTTGVYMPSKLIKDKPKGKLQTSNNVNSYEIIKKRNEGDFIPFVNKISPNIDSREFYFKNLLKYLNVDVSSMNNCLEFTGLRNGKATFKIGDNIIAKYQIGSDSEFGIVYLSSFRDSDNKPFLYAIKIQKLIEEAILEIDILEKLRNALLKKISPHFPYLYSTLYCNDVRKDFQNIDIDILPETIQEAYESNTPLVMILNELASGDLEMFIKDNSNNNELIINAYVQVVISLFSFSMVTGLYHGDTHWGNFLYHKIKPGGFVHYRIQGDDYYLENKGYLFTIWDFGASLKIPTEDDAFIFNDFMIMSQAFINETDNNEGWAFGIDNELSSLINAIKKRVITEFDDNDTDDQIRSNFLKNLFKIYTDVGFILRRPPIGGVVINKKPYIIRI